LHLVAADHLGQRQAEFGSAHRPGERDEHLAVVLEVPDVAVGGIDQRRGVEVAIVVPHEAGDGLHVIHSGTPSTLATMAASARKKVARNVG
jgi:predicted S18 family serine protease